MTYAQSLAMCNQFVKKTNSVNWRHELYGLIDALLTSNPAMMSQDYLRGFERGKAQLAFEHWCREKGIAI